MTKERYYQLKVRGLVFRVRHPLVTFLAQVKYERLFNHPRLLKIAERWHDCPDSYLPKKGRCWK